MVDLKEDCLMAGVNEENRVDNASTSSSSSSSSSQAGNGSAGGGVGGDETKKACTGCNTTTTPLWRGGPAGPKTLCNACGIKYRKKRRAMMGIETGSGGKKGDKAAAAAAATTTTTKMSSKSNNNNNKSGITKKPRSPKTSISLGVAQPASATKSSSKTAMKKMGGGGNNSWDRSAVWRKLGEEEQAAMLLIAMSCGSCYA